MLENENNELEFKAPDPKLIEEAIKNIKSRSFSGRHPELGKMIKCQVCKRRHRGSQCEQKFAITYVTEALNEETGQFEIERESSLPKDTIKGFVGAAAFKGKRKMPRGNGKMFEDNRLVELTQVLFPKYQEHYTLDKEKNELVKTFATDKDAMHAARGEAAAILRRGRKAKAKKKRQQQQLSRAINRGLV